MTLPNRERFDLFVENVPSLTRKGVLTTDELYRIYSAGYLDATQDIKPPLKPTKTEHKARNLAVAKPEPKPRRERARPVIVEPEPPKNKNAYRLEYMVRPAE